MHRATIKLNAAGEIRREQYQGRMHTVVPAVIIVAGVLNQKLVPAEELAKFPDAWNGRPVPIYHPERNGEPVSAAWPDILERAPGVVFNTTVDGDRLRSEFWLDEQRMDGLGLTTLLADIQAGKTIEVSTGYFCDELAEAGEFNGKPYIARHANLRPDHVALLPEQTGACSIADGCGAPRVNQQGNKMDKSRIATMLASLGAAMGITTNCSCEGSDMKATAKDIQALATNVKAKGVDLADLAAGHGLAVNFDIAALEGLSENGRAALYGALKALDKASTKANEGGEGEDDEAKKAAMKANAAAAAATPVAMTAAQVQAMIDAGIQKGLEARGKAEVIGRLTANSACVFDAKELQAMSLENLTKYEQSLRPVDYSGAAGGLGELIANSENDSPLAPPACLMAPPAAKN